MSPPTPMGFSKWLDSYLDPLFRLNSKVDQKKIKSAYREIADVAYSHSLDASALFDVLMSKKINRLFLKKPDIFVKLAKATGRHAIYAFRTLRSDKIFSMFKANHKRTIKAFVDLINATGKSGIPETADAALAVIATGKLSDLFSKNPSKLTKLLGKLAITTGMASPAAISSLREGSIADLFISRPTHLVSMFSKIADLADKMDTAIFFVALARSNFAAFFVRDPSIVYNFLKKFVAASRGNGGFVFRLLFGGGKLTYLFEVSPGKTIGSLNKLLREMGRNSYYVIPFLANEKIAFLFSTKYKKLIASLKRLIKAVGKHAQSGFIVLHQPGFVDLFISDEKLLLDCLTKIVGSSGRNADELLMLFESEQISAEFLRNPKKLTSTLVALSGAVGKGSPILPALFKSPPIREAFSNNPYLISSAFEDISKAGATSAKIIYQTILDERIGRMFAEQPQKLSGMFTDLSKEKNTVLVFSLIQKESVVYAFARSPEAFVATLLRTLGESGRNSRNVLQLLQNERIARAFASEPEKLSSALINIANSTGKNAPRLLEVLGNEGVSRFIESEAFNIEEFATVLIGIVKAAGPNSPEILELFTEKKTAITLLEERYYLLRGLEVLEQSEEIKARGRNLLFSIIKEKDIAPLFAAHPLSVINKFRTVWDFMSYFPKAKPYQGFEALRKNKKIRKAFIDYCKSYPGVEEHIAEKTLVPAMEAYFKGKK
jgi:hypothetical protein